MRVATWNLCQVFPRKTSSELFRWAEENICADVYVFTEATVPVDLDDSWSIQCDPSGVYPGKRPLWGTVIASRTCELRPVTEVKSILRTRKLEFPWPAAVQVCDIVKGDEVWGTVAGLYAVTKNRRGEKTGSGAYSFPESLSRLNPLMSSSRGKRMIVAGDFNLWPGHVKPEIRGSGLVDLVEATAGTREPLANCHDCKHFKNTRNASNECGHLWTHRNGARPKPNGKPFGGMIQQIDFILASEQLASSVTRVDGGGQKFPDIWHISDHAPVIVDFAD